MRPLRYTTIALTALATFGGAATAKASASDLALANHDLAGVQQQSPIASLLPQTDTFTKAYAIRTDAEKLANIARNAEAIRQQLFVQGSTDAGTFTLKGEAAFRFYLIDLALSKLTPLQWLDHDMQVEVTPVEANLANSTIGVFHETGQLFADASLAMHVVALTRIGNFAAATNAGGDTFFEVIEELRRIVCWFEDAPAAQRHQWWAVDLISKMHLSRNDRKWSTEDLERLLRQQEEHLLCTLSRLKKLPNYYHDRLRNEYVSRQNEYVSRACNERVESIDKVFQQGYGQDPETINKFLLDVLNRERQENAARTAKEKALQQQGWAQHLIGYAEAGVERLKQAVREGAGRRDEL